MNDELKNNDEADVEIVPDEDAGMADPAARIKRLKADLARIDKERKEYLDGWQRAKADMINYRKDERSRFEDLARYATGDMIQDLIGVLDNFDLALGAGVPPEVDPVRGKSPEATADAPQARRVSNGVEKGIVLIRGQLENILRKQGVETVDTKGGDVFDPAWHEAIGEEESTAPAGAIARVLQKAYRLQGRIIRPARVKLSKGANMTHEEVS